MSKFTGAKKMVMAISTLLLLAVATLLFLQRSPIALRADRGENAETKALSHPIIDAPAKQATTSATPSSTAGSIAGEVEYHESGVDPAGSHPLSGSEIDTSLKKTVEPVNRSITQNLQIEKWESDEAEVGFDGGRAQHDERHLKNLATPSPESGDEDNTLLEKEAVQTLDIEEGIVGTEEITSTQEISRATIPAFPGAEGFGAMTAGGRGGQVIEVTNLADDGPGTLREAIKADGPRIVVFRLGGTIELSDTLRIRNPYITIAGQTAPGDGITIKNHPSNKSPSIRIQTHDVIIRYLRVRPGPSEELSDQVDAVSIGHPEQTVHNVIIDHSSFSWGTDETVQTWYDTQDITIQWSIISEALDCSTHSKGCHSKGLLIGAEGAGRISVHHNLLAHNRDRNPMIKTSDGTIDLVNNVIYNMGHGSISYDNYGVPPVNIVANYYIDGPNTDSVRFEVDALTSSTGGEAHGHAIFVQGNISPHRPRDDMPEWAVVDPDGWQFLTDQRHDAPFVTTTSAAAAYSDVVEGVGAVKPVRDAIDTRIINDVQNQTGGWINSVFDVGGWQEMASGTPLADSDHDAMPDEWEQQFGLDDSDPSDRNGDMDGDGYTNLEEYLNGTNP